MPLVGFLMDTTLATAHLVFAGVPERYPNIKWVLGHLGGAIPYLAERLDRGYEAFAECRANITKPPTEYLKHFYFGASKTTPDSTGSQMARLTDRCCISLQRPMRLIRNGHSCQVISPITPMIITSAYQ